MRQSRRRPLRNHWILPMAVSLAALSCGYGFGNHEFGRQRTAALVFAQTLQAGDTARMRSLSAPEAWEKVATLARQVARSALICDSWPSVWSTSPSFVQPNDQGVVCKRRT
jgi:hypothetical protein